MVPGTMKALIITPMHPELSLVGGVGVTRRMKLFMSAMGGLADDIHVAYLAPSSLLDEDQDALERLQGRFWGLPIKMTLVPRGTRHETFRNHYLDGIWRTHDQPGIYSFAVGPNKRKRSGHCWTRRS